MTFPPMQPDPLDPAGPGNNPGTGGKIILYCAADLLWATKIKETGAALGIPCRPVRSIDMLEARLADSLVAAVLLDLEAGPACFDLLARLRGPASTPEQRAIPVVAFGPHVDVEALRRAQQAGATAVMARGALHRGLPQILKGLSSGAALESQLED